MIDGLLDDLASSDVDAIRRGLDRCADRLKRGDLDDASRGRVATAVVERAAHRSAKVRQAVAEAALHLPDDAFEQILPDLLHDPNGFVKRSATRTFDERSKRRRSEHLRDEQGAHITRLLAQLERDHGKAARRAVDYINERQTEFFVQKMHHELAKVATSLKVALVTIRAEARRPEIDRVRLAKEADLAFSKYELLMAIVDAARSHAELVPPSFAPENLASLVQEAETLLRDRIGPGAERLRVESRVAPALTLDVDRGAIMQAFSNVLQNAVEAFPADGEMRIEIESKPQKAGTQIAIAFRDHGAGIAKDSLPYVVEPFSSSKPGGRGLGLANVRKMVETVHGGTLLLDSARGVGTTVTMVLPRKQARGA
jgi:signal transduction histidine kinase